MIVRLLDATGNAFYGVRYNDRKVNKGDGELMLMKNFPSFINEESSQVQVRDYLRAISSQNTRIKNPQFHAVISTKFREHSSEELTKIAEEFMGEMGYGNQPYIVVHHNDTDNNHVHIVTTRVDKTTGKKIYDGWEKLRSQRALSIVMNRLYHSKSPLEKIDSLLEYKYSSQSQLETLLHVHGFKVSNNKTDENAIDILKNGVVEKTIHQKDLVFSSFKNEIRVKQIQAILEKYKEKFSNKVFKVEDNRENEGLYEKGIVGNAPVKLEFESELQKKLKEMFGFDIVFHNKDDKDPFGYTLIDNAGGKIYKGSEIMKMKELFEFTEGKIDKKTFEVLKDYNVRNSEDKDVLLTFLKYKYPDKKIEDYMLFSNWGNKKAEVFKEIRNESFNYVTGKVKNNKVEIFNINGENYVFHAGHHYMGKLSSMNLKERFEKSFSKSFSVLSEISNTLYTANELIEPNYVKNNPAEDKLNKKRRRRR